VTTPGRHGAAHPVPPLRASARTLVVLEGLVSVCGLGGGVFMATHPVTAMPLGYLEGTWFHTWRWPGLALFFFVGVCPAVVAAAAVMRLPGAALGHVCVGTGLVVWILVEATWVVVSPPLQVAVALVGVVILVLGVAECRR
jgi:hypothetical protein